MEVHHHPDLHHKPKKWKEYLLEYIMIVLAVTTGFLAESLRENTTNRTKEKEYMESMLQDLAADTMGINEFLAFAERINAGLDTLSKALYNSDDSKSSTLKIYQLVGMYSRTLFADFNDQTAVQLRSSGGLQLIKKTTIANAISAYWITLKANDEYNKKLGDRFDDDTEYSYAIFNRSYIHFLGIDSTTHMSIVTIDSSAHLMTTDKNVLINYANRIARRQTNNALFFIRNLNLQKKNAIELMTLIKKEYHPE